jgi:branched-chain amino acid transport system substrate-binding protein
MLPMPHGKSSSWMEGLQYNGPTGMSWMRAEDHQMLAPLYVMRFVKAGRAGVKHDAEGTGYGWKTETVFEAMDTAPQVACTMRRP